MAEELPVFTYHPHPPASPSKPQSLPAQRSLHGESELTTLADESVRTETVEAVIIFEGLGFLVSTGLFRITFTHIPEFEK